MYIYTHILLVTVISARANAQSNPKYSEIHSESMRNRCKSFAINIGLLASLALRRENSLNLDHFIFLYTDLSGTDIPLLAIRAR